MYRRYLVTGVWCEVCSVEQCNGGGMSSRSHTIWSIPQTSHIKSTGEIQRRCTGCWALSSRSTSVMCTGARHQRRLKNSFIVRVIGVISRALPCARFDWATLNMKKWKIENCTLRNMSLDEKYLVWVTSSSKAKDNDYKRLWLLAERPCLRLYCRTDETPLW